MKKILLFLALVSLLVTSCKKEKTGNELEKFPILYKAVINDSDSSLERIYFYSYTYFPFENLTIIYYDGKSNRREIDDERYLHPCDSIEYTPELNGYTGCITYLELIIHFNDSLNISPKTYFVADTISNSNERVIVFNWPEDTIRH